MNLINLMEYHITAEIWRLEMEVMRHILPHRFSIPTFHFLLFFSLQALFLGRTLNTQAQYNRFKWAWLCFFIFLNLTIILVGLLWRFPLWEEGWGLWQNRRHYTANIKSQNDHPYWLSLCNKCLHKAIKLWFSCNGKATSLFIAMHTVLQQKTSKDSIFFSNFKINDNHYRI